MHTILGEESPNGARVRENTSVDEVDIPLRPEKMQRTDPLGDDDPLNRAGVEVEAPHEDVVPGSRGGRGVGQDLPQDAPGEVAGDLGVEQGPAAEGDTEQQGGPVDPEAAGDDIPTPVGEVEGASEGRGLVGSAGPVCDPWDILCDPQLGHVAPDVEDLPADELAEVGVPEGQEVLHSIPVYGRLRPHVAGLRELPAPDFSDLSADSLVHIVLHPYNLDYKVRSEA